MFGGSFSLGMGGIPWVIMSEVQLLLEHAFLKSKTTTKSDCIHCLWSDISNKCEGSSRKHGDSCELVGFMDHYIFLQLSSRVELSRSVLFYFFIASGIVFHER